MPSNLAFLETGHEEGIFDAGAVASVVPLSPTASPAMGSPVAAVVPLTPSPAPAPPPPPLGDASATQQVLPCKLPLLLRAAHLHSHVCGWSAFVCKIQSVKLQICGVCALSPRATHTVEYLNL